MPWSTLFIVFSHTLTKISLSLSLCVCVCVCVCVSLAEIVLQSYKWKKLKKLNEKIEKENEKVLNFF